LMDSATAIMVGLTDIVHGHWLVFKAASTN
jgi:hypothetical protein